MDTKHTPGPWEARHNTYALWRVVRASDGVTLWIGGCAQPTEADARLTAAAPDLLECCRDALHDAESCFVDPDDLSDYWKALNERLRAAIAKATGGPP